MLKVLENPKGTLMNPPSAGWLGVRGHRSGIRVGMIKNSLRARKRKP